MAGQSTLAVTCAYILGDAKRDGKTVGGGQGAGDDGPRWVGGDMLGSWDEAEWGQGGGRA